MNLNIDNPMTILSQDTARMFLANSTPKDKYQFFAKGTQIDQLDINLKKLQSNIESAVNAISTKEEVWSNSF